MKVLLVNGSPNSDGCTYVALSEVSDALNEAGIESEIYQVGHRNIRGCVDCKKCYDTGYCVFDDDVVNEFIDYAEEFDGFVFGGPVYYGSVNPTLTNFMTRVFYASFFGGKRIFRLKPAAAVCSARRAGTMTSLDIINRFFSWAEMPIISSTYWNVIHGLTADDARKDLEGLQTMRNLGRNMAWFLKVKEYGLNAGIELPGLVRDAHTNL